MNVVYVACKEISCLNLFSRQHEEVKMVARVEFFQDHEGRRMKKMKRMYRYREHVIKQRAVYRMRGCVEQCPRMRRSEAKVVFSTLHHSR
jgi:hypothetical protein